MQKSHLQGIVASGGTILQLTGDAKGRLWAVSPAGLFRQNEMGWRSVRRGVPFWRLTAVLAHRNMLWVAGLPGGIIRSTNAGRTWNQCWVEQTQAPIVAMTLSGNYTKDRVLLAATDGDGILRSTDGGRHWELSNFGLREFSVLDIVAAPLRGRYEDIFAITESGLYSSPNGGRAWRKIDLDQPAIEPLALAVSPNFATDQTVCFGTAGGQLFMSTDAGQTWQLSPTDFDTINALSFNETGSLLVGTMSAIIETQLTDTPTIDNAVETPPVLTFTQFNNTQYAGLYGGLLKSEDNGRSWQPDPTFAARRFVWYRGSHAGNLLAAGPDEGVWLSQNQGETWEAIWEEEAVLALAQSESDKQLWLSTPETILVSNDNGRSWNSVQAPTPNIIALQAIGETLWAGNQAGQLWRWQRGKWTKLQTPFANTQLLALFSDGDSILTAVWNPQNRMVEIWRSKKRGEGWSRWFAQLGKPLLPHVLFGETAVVGLGIHLYQQTADGWQRHRVTSQSKPITALIRHESKLFASFTEGLVMSADNGKSWTAVSEDLKQESIVGILATTDGKGLLVGTADGRFYKLSLE